ncbi:Peroxin 13, N-terminal region-domain-containing protein [Scheffersomyces coipomensis]|uniref:Peroxin 13, N-terminal region-domain-containing protein n=1 Tax=Scheffersomyces coipomensis TaxID=1788519 RepID=UPI00315DD757
MSSIPPRPKPWEVSSGTSSASVSGGEAIPSATNIDTSGIGSIANNAAANAAAALPDRPTSLTSDFNNMANSSPYGTANTTGYGGYGSRYGAGGGYGSSMYGNSSMYGSGMYGSSYGGMGSGYGSSMYGMGGGYGSGMYGMGSYGAGGMYGQPGMMGPGGGPGMLGEGTQATFQLIESIIGAVGGFAQMLEATYMATHSSFFTMVSLAEQFGNLKNALGSLLGIFALINLVKKVFHKITGNTYNYGINLSEFSKFEKQQKKLEDNIKRQQQGKPARMSFKPLLIFLAASIGLPYLLSKAIQRINEQNQRKFQQQQQLMGPGNANGAVGGTLDPSSLQFAKTLYEFNPENPAMEIELKPNELVAILSKQDPLGNESKWWKVRSRSGKVGYVPSNYLSVIERKSQQKQVDSVPAQPQSQPQVISQADKVQEFNEKGGLSVADFQKFQN